MIELNGVQISDNNINTKKNVKIYVDENELLNKLNIKSLIPEDRVLTISGELEQQILNSETRVPVEYIEKCGVDAKKLCNGYYDEIILSGNLSRLKCCSPRGHESCDYVELAGEDWDIVNTVSKLQISYNDINKTLIKFIYAEF